MSAGFGAGDDYLDRVVAAQAAAEAVGIPVILVRVGFCPGYPEVSPRNAVFSAIRSSGRMQLGDQRRGALDDARPTSTTGSRYWPTCAWTPMRYTGC